MIDEEKTLEKFGYNSKFLTLGSARKVVVTCPDCGVSREVIYYTTIGNEGRCMVCAQRKRRMKDV